MSILLLRDSEIYLSTVDIDLVSPTADNTTKLNILAGFSMVQDSSVATYSTFRQSNTPSRVDARYVKDLSFVDVKFSTYIKIAQVNSLAEPADKLLWEALSNNGTTQDANSYTVDFLSSSTNEFPDLYIYIDTGSQVFKIGKCYIADVTFDFDINGIGRTDWTVKGITYTKVPDAPATYLDRTEITNYIVGRFSKIDFIKAGISYLLPLLGGKVKMEQSVTRLSTPIVSQAIAVNPKAVIEGRSVVADIDVYLRTGQAHSLGLIESMLNSLATINDTSQAAMHLGDTNSKHVSISMPTALTTVPKINADSVFTTNMQIFPRETATGSNDDISLTFYN